MEKKKSTLKEVLDEITKLERSNLSSEEMVTYLSTSDMDWSTLRAYSLLSGKDELASKIEEAKNEISRRNVQMFQQAVLENQASEVLDHMPLSERIFLKHDFENPVINSGDLEPGEAVALLNASVEKELSSSNFVVEPWIASSPVIETTSTQVKAR